MELEGKVAIVTGATGTLGRGICSALARRGMRLIIADLDQERCDDFAAEIAASGPGSLGVRIDVTSAASCTAMVRRCIEVFGQIDALINNAGVIEVAPMTELSETSWDRVIDVNLKGTFLCTQAVVPHMIARKTGRIVNVASVAAKRPAPLQTAYAASKHGIVGLSQVWCQELAPHDITVNTLCPGFIDSPMWHDHLGPALAKTTGADPADMATTLARTLMPLGRPQTPRDMGEAVAYLCTADNVTGQTLTVDGGLTMY
ncbi:NAD(P)-dependent dehydrogenase (short-subunit alcohol dehydrogenase family) [Azospirillum fermentarium]|uniref:SDR family NAD(P)-dependent oxidoreductase n=1 Tax=Azospirillum fermentarium TaxID=1233114 RepID=UPI0022266E23|nr:SDR family NAD(P)-dependent oxidoreductase [Azospirillum fermentarium]MCW2249271.1 NAD(P)-dependent dehydrogenase (short-subunit alcohol dehydrogenase family) [Azospirillum fermentarium]